MTGKSDDVINWQVIAERPRLARRLARRVARLEDQLLALEILYPHINKVGFQTPLPHVRVSPCTNNQREEPRATISPERANPGNADPATR